MSDSVRMEQPNGLKQIPSCWVAIGLCLLHSLVYIASLYIWNYKHGRNHVDSILKRFLSVFVMLFISPIFLYLALDNEILEKKTIWAVLGFRTDGLLQALVMPLFLTMILHLGPLALLVNNGLLKLYTEPMYWVNNAKDLIWLRSQIIAPLSEEFSFRSCMLPILLQCFPPLTAVFVCPIFFGAAHFHHLFEKIKNKVPLKFAVIESCVQFTYTTIFGVYSAYLFLRTGHFISIFIAHSFCNHMGVPDFEEFMRYNGTQKYVIGSLFVIGLVSWCFLLNPLTEPKWYYNG